MDKSALKKRIATGEDFHTEFKENLPDREAIAKTLVSFANTDGGDYIVGVTNDNKIVSIGDLDQVMRIIDDIAHQRCEPPITVIQETIKVDNKIVLVVHIPKGSHRPYRTASGRFYIRSANHSRQASREELLRIFQADRSLFFDESPVANATYNDLNFEVFSEFLYDYFDIKANDEQLRSYLRNLHLIDNKNKPTLSGLLFFGKKPQNFFPTAKIICAFIKATDISVAPTDKKEMTGRVLDILQDTQRFVKLYLTEEHRVQGFEPEMKFEIPEAALREALVNALAHRDYTINAAIRVLIFTDRIEIRTPGKLPNTVTIESMKIGGSHVLRNPTVYNLLSKYGFVTDLGSGVRRIIKLIKEHLGKDVELIETDNEFVLILPRASNNQ